MVRTLLLSFAFEVFMCLDLAMIACFHTRSLAKFHKTRFQVYAVVSVVRPWADTCFEHPAKSWKMGTCRSCWQWEAISEPEIDGGIAVQAPEYEGH